jgi:hypothetical protein
MTVSSSCSLSSTTQFILVAHYCMKLNNFNSMMEVVSGLNQSPVLLLKNLWSSLPSKVSKKWEVREEHRRRGVKEKKNDVTDTHTISSSRY